jgi:hypothetical protein
LIELPTAIQHITPNRKIDVVVKIVLFKIHMAKN